MPALAHHPPIIWELSWVGVGWGLSIRLPGAALALAGAALNALPPSTMVVGELLPGTRLWGWARTFRKPAGHLLPNLYDTPGHRTALGSRERPDPSMLASTLTFL